MELVQNIGENAASSSDLRALFHSFAPRSPLQTACKGLRQEPGRRALNKQSLAF
jgi:hypothetical protein